MTPTRATALLAALGLLGPALLAGCERVDPATPLTPLPAVAAQGARAATRVNGYVGTPNAQLPAQVSLGETAAPGDAGADGVAAGQPGGRGAQEGAADISLDFADTDIREVVAQILGTILKVNYTIDPTVHGTTTLRTVAPLTRGQLLPTLQTILSQNGATLVRNGGVYRVLPAAAATGAPGSADGATAGSTVVRLRYASAEDLAKVLMPFVANGGRILANPGSNALVISGDPTTREALVGLVGAFDIDTLSNQSYALLPVGTGDAQDIATAMQAALHAQGGGPAQSSVVRIAAMSRINAVLVIAPQARMIEDARRIYQLVVHQQRLTVRSWHVYYLQNSRSNDVAYVLQQAFTPNNVTAQPPHSGAGSTAPGGGMAQIGGGGFGGQGGGSGGGGFGSQGGGGGFGGQGGGSSGGLGSGGLGSSGSGGSGSGGLGSGGLGSGGLGSGGLGSNGGGQQAAAAPAAQSNPLLGGLGGGGGDTGGQADVDAMRIIPNQQNNALVIYATGQEESTIEAMLHKIDILPLQVRIDAVIAEVDLNDSLQYGTQFYFTSGIEGALSQGASAAGFATGFPGFVLSGQNSKNFAINALQNVTKVKVLSSPQLLVLDNEQASLQVGSQVPFLTQSSQSTLTSNAPVVNSVDYRATGVIMNVTPKVNSNGLVTLDIAQEVSSVDPNPPQQAGTQINSPTFLERAVQSRVVVQDGQTIGLAGLISDNASTGNSGIPFLKDLPILGFLAGNQNNARTRTELLVLLTPHVIHDQRDARALTEDLRDTLNNAAQVPAELNLLPLTGSPDPQARFRRHLQVKTP